MRHLDLADVVAIAAEVCEVEVPKVLELLDTPELHAVLAEARSPLPPHEAAGVVLTGIVALAPLPAGNRRFALLAAVHLLAVNGLELTLDQSGAGALFAAGADVTALLDGWVTARDPLEGELRRLLSPDAEQAVALALQRARRHRRNLADPGDLLMGVFRAGGPGGRALGNEAGGVRAVSIPPRPPVPVGRRSFDADVRKAFERAMRAATTRDHREINTGHLLLGLLDGGHAGHLPEGLGEADVRRRLPELLRPDTPVGERLARLADRLRTADPGAAAELDELARRQRAGLDRLVAMIRAWRGDIFLDAMARDPTLADLLGGRLSAPADQDLLDGYLAGIAGYPPLTREEEVELAQSLREDGRRLLIQSNLQLVVSIAREYEGKGLSLLDLIQEGNLGLMRAAEHFNPTKGYRFATFATWWIRRAITDALARPGE